MQRNEACGENLSRLGFGCMRLPLTADKAIDEKELRRMTDYALEHGVNYFDTAWPYHGGHSEIAIGKALAAHPRETWFLADKFPGHQVAERYDPAAVFEEQLKKCGVEYFDFYLLHNVYENSFGVYTDPRWDILNYFLRQKERGRIRHLGFSSHARPDTLEKFLNWAGDAMEFCQIQLNCVDWTLQDARAKYELLTARGLPVWVMEPLRGGKLANLPEKDAEKLRALRPGESAASWSFRWLMRLPNVKMVLSGMSDFAQMEDNVRTFSSGAPQTDAEAEVMAGIAEGLKNALPCTRCRYCCDGCPMQLDIPMLIHAYNDLKFSGSMTVPMQMDALPEDKRPSACVACGACAAVCPQKIDIPAAMAEFAGKLASMPSWADMCREREEAARRLREAEKPSVLSALAEDYPLLYLDPDEDSQERYRAVVLRGEDPGKKSLAHYRGHPADRLETLETPMGPIRSVTLGDRGDFERVMRGMMAAKDGPEKAVPESQGAAMMTVFNWRKIHTHLAAFPEDKRNEEFRRFTSVRENYLDMLVVISRGPYSHISAEQAGIPEEEWLDVSDTIRRYHELTHVICRRGYPEDIVPVRDELIADAVGLVAAFGRFDGKLERLFLGVQDGRYTGGRLSGYTQEPEALAPAVDAAVRRLEEMLGAPQGGTDPFSLIPRLMEAKLL